MYFGKIAVACMTYLSLVSEVNGCMGDAACNTGLAEGEGEQCCYMNRCVPITNVGCSTARLNFHKEL